jgi:hypothetical protein
LAPSLTGTLSLYLVSISSVFILGKLVRAFSTSPVGLRKVWNSGLSYR